MFKVGMKFLVKSTPTNKLNRLTAKKGAWVRFVDAKAVTFFFEQNGMSDLKVPRPLIGNNFDAQKMAPINTQYAASRHAKKLYKTA